MQQQQKLFTKFVSFSTPSSWTLNEALHLFFFFTFIFYIFKVINGGAQRLKIKSRTTSKISCTWGSWRFVFFMWLFLLCVLFAPYLQVIVGDLTSPGPPEADLLNQYVNACKETLYKSAQNFQASYKSGSQPWRIQHLALHDVCSDFCWLPTQ